METISIRDLRGTELRARTRKGEPLAITNHRVLIGVIIPAAEGWAQHLICQNWPQVRRNITQAEETMADGAAMTTIDDIDADPDVTDSEALVSSSPIVSKSPVVSSSPAKPSVSLDAAIVDGAVAQTPQSREVIERLHAAWNPPGPASQEEVTDPSPVQALRTVRIGDLSAAVIKEAGESGLALAVTHDRELIGVLVPVTQDLVQFLIEQNISRVLNNIDQGEEHLQAAAQMTTLDQEIPPETAGR